MIEYSESCLPRADQNGSLPDGTLEYSRGIIELRIQGKPVAKMRKQWADYICGVDEASKANFKSVMMRGIPFRSYDTRMTQGKDLQRALLQLESPNKARPDAGSRRTDQGNQPQGLLGPVISLAVEV